MPAPSGPQSGKNGYVWLNPTSPVSTPGAVVSAVRNWTLNDIMTAVSARTSGTNNGTQRVRGVEDFNGTFNGYGGEPPVLPGDFFNLKFYTSPWDGVKGNPGATYVGKAVVDSITVNMQWVPDFIINYDVNFSGVGELTVTDDVAVPGVVCPDLDICEANVLYAQDCTSQSPLWVVWENLTALTFNITAENLLTYNSSSLCQPLRYSGPIDWNMVLTEQETYPTTPPPYGSGNPAQTLSKGETIWLRFWLNNVIYWDLNWAYLQDWNNINVNIETGEIITKDANLFMQACCGPVLGKIVTPSGRTYWDATSVQGTP